MFASRYLPAALLFLLAAVPCLAESGVPSLTLSTAEMPGWSGGTLTLMVVPDGSGPGFDESVGPGGANVDATIELILKDSAGDPIALFPYEDLWLEPGYPDDGLTGCLGLPNYPARLVADAHTDLEGRTRWSAPPSAGGYSAQLVGVMVNGAYLASSAGFALRFNSPDITGDGLVNLSDIVPFAQDYYGEYHFRSDLEHDGAVNLSDVVKLAEHFGAGCP